MPDKDEHTGPTGSDSGADPKPGDEIYELEPADEPSAPAAPPKPAPPDGALKARIEAESLTSGFDEDADFDHDPEVERAIKGERAKPPAKSEPAEIIPPFADERGPNVQVLIVLGAAAAVGALVAAGINATGGVIVAILLTLYGIILHTLTGGAAVAVAAQIEGRALGRIDLVAGRMLVAVAAFALLINIDTTVLARFDEVILAAAAYWGTIMALFRLSPRRSVLVAGPHLLIAVFLAAGQWLAAWAESGTQPPQ